jgi:glutamate synthase (NADPH/NADH) small chain
MGHTVIVFEKDERVGGLLRYGIPDFKIEKWVVDRRIQQLAEEGVVFRTGVEVGVDLPADALLSEFEAVCLAGGAQTPRDLPVPGRELEGVHFAMDYLTQQNRILAGDEPRGAPISAEGKRVVVIGGGDTGSDCLGTSHRQGATEVVQIEIMPTPPLQRAESTPWPYWPMKLRTSHAHEEGGQREWSIMTKRFLADEDGRVRAIEAVRVEPGPDGRGFVEIPGSAYDIEADLVLLAMGFTGPYGAILDQLGVERDQRSNVKANRDHATNVEGVYVAGDMRMGASLIVWAIREGRDAAAAIDRYLREGAGVGGSAAGVGERAVG